MFQKAFLGATSSGLRLDSREESRIRLGVCCVCVCVLGDPLCPVSPVVKDRPLLPPSRAQAVLPSCPPEDYSYQRSLLNLGRNRAFLLLLVTYGEPVYGCVRVRVCV